MPYNLHRRTNGVPAFQANINRDRNTHIEKVKRYYDPTNKHYYKLEKSPCKTCHQRESQFHDCVEIINSDEKKHKEIVEEIEHIECKCRKCIQKRDKYEMHKCEKKSSSEKYEESVCQCNKCQINSHGKDCESTTVYKTILWCKKCETEIRNNRCRCKNMWYDS